MSENKMNDTGSISKKIEDLDNELNTFLEAVKEIKAIKDSLCDLPGKLKHQKEELGKREKELDDLMSRADELLSYLSEMKKRIPELQVVPQDNDRKLKELEKRLTSMFFSNLRRQKTVILIILALLMASAGFSVFMFLAR